MNLIEKIEQEEIARLSANKSAPCFCSWRHSNR
jgi:hypothetical protein